MNREDLLSEINRLMVKGYLTRDEFLSIGIDHKSLPASQKNWKWLKDVTRWPGTEESYRQFVKRSVPRRKKEEPVILDESNEAAKQEMFKERQRLRDERTNLNRKLRDEARIERLRDSIVEAVSSLDDLPFCDFEGKGVIGRKEAILMVSDLHIGMQIDEYCNKYDSTIAAKRVERLVEETIRYCKDNCVERLNVVNLGDLIHGDIHETIRIEEEFDVVTQVIQASELMSRALNKLQEAAPEVIYRSCSDNHSRVVANKKESIEKENFFRLVDWYLEERLKDTSIKFAHDNISVSMGKFRLLNGKLVMFAHGHMNKPNHAFQDFIGATEEYVHYVLLGHYHSEKTKYFQNLKVLINGSICGVDQYAESIRKYTKPSQTLLVFDGDNLINHSIGLDIR